MTRQDTAKILSLIKLSYPASYQHIDRDTANAIITMWQMTFCDLPYPIMAQAYDRYRMTHKFPPTVAEIVEELRHIYYDALETTIISKQLDNQEMSNHYKLVMAHTKRYADEHIVSRETGRKDFFDNLMESVSVSFNLENGYTRKYEE